MSKGWQGFKVMLSVHGKLISRFLPERCRTLVVLLYSLKIRVPFEYHKPWTAVIYTPPFLIAAFVTCSSSVWEMDGYSPWKIGVAPNLRIYKARSEEKVDSKMQFSSWFWILMGFCWCLITYFLSFLRSKDLLRSPRRPCLQPIGGKGYTTHWTHYNIRFHF